MDPKVVKGLDISFDYFESVTHDFFGSITEQTIIQSVEDLGPASPYNSLIHFGNITGANPTAPGQISSHPSHSVWIFDSEINVGSTAIKGWDATVDYSFPTAMAGKFDLISQITFYNSYLFQAIPTENYYQYAGKATENEGTVSRYRTYTTLDWKFHGLRLLTNNTFIPSVLDEGSGGSTASAPVHVSSYVQEDFAASYQFDHGVLGGVLKGVTVTAGINNAFNRNIPFASGAFPDTYGDVGNYNGAIGRMYYVDLDYRF
jgi:iron complex outermembrane receptor protein